MEFKKCISSNSDSSSSDRLLSRLAHFMLIEFDESIFGIYPDKGSTAFGVYLLIGILHNGPRTLTCRGAGNVEGT